MNLKISVVINTLNEERNVGRAIESVKWADEIIVCDMYSEDKTVEIAKKLGAKIFCHKREDFVEPARNFAISKASNDWVLILDSDEEIPQSLALKIEELTKNADNVNYVEIPRKNTIFNKWMKASMWWPDYHIRLFRKGKVVWNNTIHSKPQIEGKGVILPQEEPFAITHHNYQFVSQFIERMNRYSSIQARELKNQSVVFEWEDLIEKPLGEFLSRFFAQKGYLDGLHGFALSLLQAFSFFVVYLKLWEFSKFKPQEICLKKVEIECKKSSKDIKYWIDYTKLSRNPFKRVLQKITRIKC